jgi:endoglucanase
MITCKNLVLGAGAFVLLACGGSADSTPSTSGGSTDGGASMTSGDDASSATGGSDAGSSGGDVGGSSTTSNASSGTGGTGGTGGSDTGTGSTATTSSDAGSAVDAGSGGAAGYLHTSGANIVDSAGGTVRLTGLSWFGFETSNFVVHGLWSRPLGDMLDQIKSLGYNTIRIPWTNEMLLAGKTPNGIDFGKNPDLMGLSPLQILDKVVAAAGARGLRIILDRHRPTSAAQSELWYVDSVPESQWIADWVTLATHFKGNPTIIGADLHNEPHGSATWGSGDMKTDWRLAAERGGNAILAVEPDWLIIVEGVEVVSGNYYWWGGNLRGAGANPVRLSVDHRLVYSVHDYPSTVSGQPWFSDPSYPSNLPSVWRATWGYLVEGGTAPVWVGEFGTKLETTSDQQWLDALLTYMQSQNVSFAYWCWNPDSGDTGGILQDDWLTVQAAKQAKLAPHLAPFLP